MKLICPLIQNGIETFPSILPASYWKAPRHGRRFGAPNSSARLDRLPLPFAFALLLATLGLLTATFANAQLPHLDRFSPGALVSVDAGFSPVMLGGGASESYAALAVQPDGKILVGGSFTTLGGQPRHNLGRLNPDGALDPTFNPAANYDVTCLALQADGKVLVGGYFTQLGGQARERIGRLNSDGTLDPTFNSPPINSGEVYSLSLQADGKILVAGRVFEWGGQSRFPLARLNPNGALDPTFNTGARGAVYDSVSFLALQADGKILVGGNFTTLGGQPRTNVGRLNLDGTVDLTFNPGLGAAYGSVSSLALQTNGKILVGGNFTTLGCQTRTNLGRLNPDGTLDSTFNPGANGWVRSLVVQTDGRILVGGYFTTLGGQPRNRMGRLQPDGTLDATFNPGTSYLASQADGKILVELPGSGIGRMHNTGPATQVLTHDGSTITWLRGGASPEVWHTTFEHSADRLNWTLLGAGTRIPGGWQLAGLPQLPAGALRARGYAAGGLGNASGWFVESHAVMDPFIVAPPLGTNRAVGDSVTLSVTAGGTPPLTYQWYRDGLAVPEATGSELTINSLSGADAGYYTVQVSNVHGGVTSSPVPLTVNLVTADAGFHSEAGLTLALAMQPDGKILVGGIIGIGRLHPDGTFDPTFNAAPSTEAVSLALQSDGKILVGGWAFAPDGHLRNGITRLIPDGTLDPSFNPETNSYVDSLVLQADRNILAGGYFVTLDGRPPYGIARLNPDGTWDATFRPGASSVTPHALQADGKILVWGSLTTTNQPPRYGIARLNPDGTLDPAFHPAEVSNPFSSDLEGSSLAVQADGKILVVGNFKRLGGQARSGIGRLNPDGTVDSTFNPGANGIVNSLALQADGKILVAGRFSTLGGQPRPGIGRLNPDGTLDPIFNPRVDVNFITLAVQADGKILAGGFPGFLGRWENTGPATQLLTHDGSTLTWLRGGTSPEVWRTTFESSDDGVNWTLLGAGTRISGGWQLADVSLPPDTTVRARGYVAGSHNASGWFVETMWSGTAPIQLHLVREGDTLVLNWTGGRGPYQVQQNADLSQPDAWQNVGAAAHTNSMALPLGSDSLFLRVRGQ